jgi:hypothetical protein
MRMRITKAPPSEYGSATQSLLVGRIYNLDVALASALLLEDCAEMYDLLSPEEKRERNSRPHEAWTPLNGAGSGWIRRA